MVHHRGARAGSVSALRSSKDVRYVTPAAGSAAFSTMKGNGASFRWLVWIALTVLVALNVAFNLSKGMNSAGTLQLQSSRQGCKKDDNCTTTNLAKDIMSFDSAISTLRCLTTPNCFPSAKCRSGNGIPQKIRRKLKYEEHAFCVQDVLEQSKKPNKNDSVTNQKSGCLVYSFGIHNSWEFEEKVAKLLHCEVHAFDPTMDHPKNLAPNTTFHKLGLQAEGTNVTATHSEVYRPVDPSLVLTLTQIMERLGHTGRTLDLLALDCEGCEWGTLKQLACNGESHLVRQLFVEFHFQSNLGLASSADVVVAGQGIQCLWRERWHIMSLQRSSAAVSDWSYTHGVSQVIHRPGFLVFASLRRIPNDELQPSDAMENVAVATRMRAANEKELNNVMVKISKPSTATYDDNPYYDP